MNPLENVVRQMKYNHIHPKGDINATILSGGSDPLIEQNLQTESKVNATRPSERGLSPITYFLRAGKCHKTISKRSCTYQTGSLTY